MAVEQPMPGLWRIEQSDGLDRATAIVRRSPLKLVASAEPSIAAPGAPVSVGARIEEYGRPLVSFARLKNLRVSITVDLPSGASIEVPVQREPEGWFRGEWVPEAAGSAELRIEAESPELNRRNVFEIEVDRQCFDMEASWTAFDVSTTIQQRQDCRDLEEVQARVRYISSEGTASPWEAASPGGQGTYSARLARSSPGMVAVEIRAVDRQRQRIFALPPIPSPVEAEPPGWGGFLLRLLAANTPLSLLGLLWLHRRQVMNLREEPA
ncbi:MAG: hypothetical protein HC923_08190 [Myxococcales bacterium]|nr:hypothetical protein [Myxococcales bacterium]